MLLFENALTSKDNMAASVNILGSQGNLKTHKLRENVNSGRLDSLTSDVYASPQDCLPKAQIPPPP